MHPDLATAIADMETRADATAGTETSTGWRHAALITRLFTSAPRIIQQLRHHAAFWKEKSPEKAAAYREAAAVITHHAGKALATLIIAESYIQPDLELVAS